MSSKWQSRSPYMQHRYASRRPAPKRRRIPRLAWLIPLCILGFFVLVNSAVFAIYSNRTYPRTKAMDTAIGSVAFSKLEEKITSQQILPSKLTLQHGDTKTEIPIASLGIITNSTRAIASAKKQRHWLPIVNFFRSPVLLAPVSIQTKTFDAKSQELATIFTLEATNARLNLENGTVTTVAASSGYTLKTNQLAQSVMNTLDTGKTRISVPVEIKAPKVTASDLQDDASGLEKQLATPLQLRYNGKVTSPTKADIGGWFIQSGEIYTLSPDKLQTYLADLGKSYGISIKDRGQVASSVTAAITNAKALDLTLTAVIATKSYAYCTATRGVDASELPALRSMLETTYSDSRGWGLGGLVGYSHVTSGCSFTVWLSAASQMPTFGAICDSMWSCRVGQNVVINFDRWQGASAAWNEYGGSLPDYRHMVINHETGHWLGFGHATCTGPGRLAAVMQQQSISLQGCKFNPWPTAGEQAVLKNRLGI